MKTKLIHAILIVFICFMGCDKNDENNEDLTASTLKLKTVDYGGCNSNKSTSNNLSFKNDTLFISSENNELTFHIGLNLNCCSEFSAESELIGDTLKMQVNSTTIGICNCICFYNFDFIYSEYYNQSLFYQLLIDNQLKFEGDLNN